MSEPRRPHGGRPADVAIAVATIVALALGWGPVAAELVDLWTANTYYTYAFLVPLFSAFVVWDTRRALAGRPAWRLEGLAVLTVALGVLAAGATLDSLVVRSGSLVLALVGVALFALGPARTRRLAFPLAFLALMTPLPEGAIPAMSLPLQLLAAASTETALSFLGVPAVRDGLFVQLPMVTLHVSEACNGLRFLLAMAVLGVAFAWATRARIRERVLVVAGALGVGVAANLVRVTGTGLLADLYGPEAASGLLHVVYGKIVYLAALVPFVLAVARLRSRVPSAAPTAVEAATGPLSVSVLVPTKNRARFLADAVRALLAQTARIDELVVVDQSADDAGRRTVAGLVAAQPAERRPALVYIWDPSISGTAAARNVALDRASGDLVVYCDDDVTPEPDVIERLVAHYRAQPTVAGLAPVITNYPVPSRALRLARAVFCRGAFADERQPVYWFWRRYTTPTLVPVRMFTGAMMSFRRAALGAIRCDSRFRGASVGEDIDMCWSLAARGAALAIATDAHIAHHKAPRAATRTEDNLITSWAFLYDKHVTKSLASRLAFVWFVTGCVLCAAFLSLRERDAAALRSSLAGVRRLLNDFEGSTFLAPRSRTA